MKRNIINTGVTLAQLCGYTGGWYWPNNNVTKINSHIFNVILAHSFITLN